MRTSGAGAFAVVAFSLVLAGCTSSGPEEYPEAQSSQSAQHPDETQSEDGRPIPQAVDGVPFSIISDHPVAPDIQVIRALDAAPLGELHRFRETGVTQPGEGSLPGPSVRAVLDSDTALAGQLKPERGIEITDLAQVPTTLGLVHEDGYFEPLESLTTEVNLLPDSNPESLYFEPQEATSSGPWVVWREGSAGALNSLPTIDFDDWRLLAWNRESGQLSELASAYLLHGERFAPRSGLAAVPTTDGEKVYFAAELPEDSFQSEPAQAPEWNWCKSTSEQTSADTNWRAGVFSIPLNEPGKVELLAPGNTPAADLQAPGAYWVQSTTCVVQNHIPLFEIATPGWFVSSLIPTSNGFAATVADEGGGNAWILVWDSVTHQIVYALESGADWVVADGNQDVLVWGNGTANSDASMYLWKQGDPAVTLLGSTQGMSLPKYRDGLLALPITADEGPLTWALYSVE